MIDFNNDNLVKNLPDAFEKVKVVIIIKFLKLVDYLSKNIWKICMKFMKY